MTKRGLARLLSTLMILAFMVSTGVVSCVPAVGPLPEPPPGGPLPGEEVAGGPPPGGELQLVFVAQPDMVPPGGCAMLHWEVAPPGEYRALLNGQEVPLVGEQQVCPPGPTTYQLLVETPSGPQTREVVVNVGGGPPGPGPQPTPPGPGPQPTPPGPGPVPTGAAGGGCAGAPTFTYFTASPSTISAGQQVQLSWGEVRNGTSGPLVASVVLSPGGFGEVGSPGSRWASPTTTTTYRLTATGCGGTATKDVTVTVGGAAPAATVTPHPGGPTATKPGGGATSTATRTPTPTSTTVGVLLTVIPFVPVPTATTTPVWGQCTWVQVGLTRSFDAPNGPRWCPDGSFLTGLDLDRTDEDPVFSPIIGQVQCCTLATGQSISWGQCSFYSGSVPWGGHHTEAWCANGYYLTEFDLLEGSDVLDEDPMDYPVVDTARCCDISGYPHGKSSCAWVGVEIAGVNSHSRRTWCPNGSFLAGLDLDRDDGSDEWDSPVVGQAYCCRP
jgi:hypothetical protein